MALSFRSLVTLCLVLVVVLVVPAFAQLAPFSPASPTGAAPPFTARSTLAATTFYGRTYIYGGGGSQGLTNDVWVSSNDGATWKLVPNANLPGRGNPALVTVQTTVNNTQLLLAIGGRGEGGTYYNEVYFSTNGQTFILSSRAAFSPRSEFATAIALPVQDQSGNPLLNGLPALFVLGGAADSGALNDVWYSSGRGQFGYVLATASAPWAARRGHRAVAVESGTRIVITGGVDRDGFTYFNDVWISDVGGVEWIRLLETAPYSQRLGFGFVNIAEKLSVFGGAGNGGIFNDIWQSLDYGRSWTRGTVNSAFTPRALFGFAVNGKDVVVVDGAGLANGDVRVLNGAVN